jgi:hypothetical protein
LTPTTYYVLLPTLSNLDHCTVGTPALLCKILLMTLGILQSLKTQEVPVW